MASRTLGTVSIVHRRREPIFAMPVRAERDAFAVDVFDDADAIEDLKRRSEPVGRVAPSSVSTLDKLTSLDLDKTGAVQKDDVPWPASTLTGASEPRERSSVVRLAIVPSVRAFESVAMGSNVEKIAEAKDSVMHAIARSSNESSDEIKVDRGGTVGVRQQGRDAGREIGSLAAPGSRVANERTNDVHGIAVDSYRASDRESHVLDSNEPSQAAAAKTNETDRDRGHTSTARIAADDARRDDRAPADHARPIDDEALTINVSIGRIDIVRPTPPSPPPPVARPSTPRPSLDDYMRVRAKVRGR